MEEKNLGLLLGMTKKKQETAKRCVLNTAIFILSLLIVIQCPITKFNVVEIKTKEQLRL